MSVRVSHDANRHATSTHVDYSRPSPPITAAGQRRYAEQVERLLVLAGAELPEVRQYQLLRRKDSGLDAALAAIAGSLKQFHLDREQAIVTLDGEPLAQALADIDGKISDLRVRIETARRAGEQFSADVERARVVARQALEAHALQAAGAIRAENARLIAAAEARLAAAIAEPADDLAALDHSIEGARTREGFAAAIERILAGEAPAAA